MFAADAGANFLAKVSWPGADPAGDVELARNELIFKLREFKVNLFLLRAESLPSSVNVHGP